MQVPIYNQPTVSDKHIAQDYQHVNINGDMTGENINRANYVLARMTDNASQNIQKYVDNVQKTVITDLTNSYDAKVQQRLYDKDNGYFMQTGKNAAGQSDLVMQDFDNYAENLIKKSGLTGKYEALARQSLAAKRNSIYAAVNKHDFDQTKEWQNNVFAEKANNIMNQAILDRNDDNLLANGLRQGYNAIDLQAQTQGWDSDAVTLKKSLFTSQYHVSVINALLSDGSLRAKSYYNAHKAEIQPDKHNAILDAVEKNELRYNARAIVEDLTSKGLSLEDAYREIDKIDNYDLQSAVRSQFEGKNREKDRIQSEQDRQKSEESWNKVIDALNTNPDQAYQAIDVTQNPDVIKAQMSYIENMRKFGEIKTGHQVYLELQDKMTYDAEGFKNTDLNAYRPYLSESDFKRFKDAQSKIGSMEYTIIQNDNKMINAALKQIGGKDKTHDVVYSEVRSMVEEFEKRHGRKINDSELQGILDSLNVKDTNGVKTFKNIEKGMAEQVGFIKAITNDFAYFEKVHKRQPDANERAKIISDRAYKRIQERKEELQDKIDATYARPNETKELTYYADSYLPDLGRELGVRFSIVEGGRYRPANGKYISKHTTGEAVDVSMSEHSQLTKLRFFETQLNNPQVKKIGTSDPYILATLKSKNGGKLPKKIEDETNFDKNYGTNHINHAHITLNVNQQKQSEPTVYQVGNYTVRVKG